MIIMNLNNKIGGKGHIVEVDESHLFVRKENSEHDDCTCVNCYTRRLIDCVSEILSEQFSLNFFTTHRDVSTVYLGYGNNTFVLEEVF